MQIVLKMCQEVLMPLLIVDLSGLRAQGPVDCERLKNDVILDCEKLEEKLMHGWWPDVLNVFVDRKQFSTIRSDKMDSFYRSVSTLISNQVRDIVIKPNSFNFFYSNINCLKF